MKYIAEDVGVPAMYWAGVEGDYNAMAMELLGPSTEELFAACHRVFSLKTCIMIAEQMVFSHVRK